MLIYYSTIHNYIYWDTLMYRHYGGICICTETLNLEPMCPFGDRTNITESSGNEEKLTRMTEVQREALVAFSYILVQPKLEECISQICVWLAAFTKTTWLMCRNCFAVMDIGSYKILLDELMQQPRTIGHRWEQTNEEDFPDLPKQHSGSR